MKIIVALMLMIPTFISAQKDGGKIDFRKVSGIVIGYDIPKDGLLVSYVGLNYAVITDSSGKFCLTIPKNKSVFIEVPICMASSITEIKPTDDFVEINVSGSTNKSDKTIASEEAWIEQKDNLVPELKGIYTSKAYELANQSICR